MKLIQSGLRSVVVVSMAASLFVGAGCAKKEEAPPAPTPTQVPEPKREQTAPVAPVAPTEPKAAAVVAAQQSVAEAVAQPAPVPPEAAAAPVPDLVGKLAGLQAQTGDLLTRYSGELSTLKSGVLAVKGYVDQHPEVLPASAKAKYQELNALMPELTSLVQSLKEAKGADLVTLAPKLATSFTRAKTLYTEVRALLPEKL